jgi:hypothetical protein
MKTNGSLSEATNFSGIVAPVHGNNAQEHGTKSKLVLEPNVPQAIAFKFSTGKLCESRYSDEKQVFFSLTDGRLAFFSLGLAQSITNLQLNDREPFNICKRWNGSREQTPRYDVWLTPEGEKRRAAEEAVPAQDPPSPLEQQLDASLAAIQARRAGAALATRRTPAAEAAPVPAKSALVDEANALVDAFAAVLERALTMYQGRVKPEEVRSIVLSAYIQRGKGGCS